MPLNNPITYRTIILLRLIDEGYTTERAIVDWNGIPQSTCNIALGNMVNDGMVQRDTSVRPIQLSLTRRGAMIVEAFNDIY